MNLFLIGYRGTGKTTVARLLAARVGWLCVDADEEIERRAGRTIAEIFADDGEDRFRDLEQQVVESLVEGEPQVVSLGGGAVLREENRLAICGAGKVVWLTASPAVILERLTGDRTTAARRPNLTAQGGLAEIEQLLSEREPLYRRCADVVLDTEHKSPDDLADHIMDTLNLHAAD